MDFLFAILSVLLVAIVILMLWKYVFSWLLVGLVVATIGTSIVKNIFDTLQSSEYAYAPYLYREYRIFRMKKQLGRLYINEPFIWTDEQADEEKRVAFEYATTIHGV